MPDPARNPAEESLPARPAGDPALDLGGGLDLGDVPNPADDVPGAELTTGGWLAEVAAWQSRPRVPAPVELVAVVEAVP